MIPVGEGEGVRGVFEKKRKRKDRKGVSRPRENRDGENVWWGRWGTLEPKI